MLLGSGVSLVPQCPGITLWSRSLTSQMCRAAAPQRGAGSRRCLLRFGHCKAPGRVSLEGALHGGSVIVLISA